MKIDLTLHDMERLIAGYKLEELELCKRYSKFKESRDLDEHSINTLDEIKKERLTEVRSRIKYFLEFFEKRNACVNALNSIYGINSGEEQVPYIIENLLKELKSKQKGDNHEN